MKYITLFAFYVIALLGFSNNAFPFLVREAVISKGEAITFENKNAKVMVVYVNSITRDVIIDGATHRINASRRVRRFDGLLGIFKSSRGFLGRPRPLSYVEGERHFESRNEAISKLYEGSTLFDWQCLENGVIGGFFLNKEGQIDVRVFRYIINGEPANDLCSSLDEYSMMHKAAGRG